MGYHVSVLDPSPAKAGDSAEIVSKKAIGLARQADYFGFRRFWLNQDPLNTLSPVLATPALARSVLEATGVIRVGALSNIWLESARSIEDQHTWLSSMSWLRSDLVIQLAHPRYPADNPADRSETTGSLEAQLLAVDRMLRAGGSASERFLVGLGVQAGELAGRLGWTLVYAGHLDADPVIFRQTIDAYRQASKGKVPVVALRVFADETESAAVQKTAGLQNYDLLAANGTLFHNHRILGAGAHSGSASSDIRPARLPVTIGTGIQIRAELDRLEALYGIEEFLLVQPPLSNGDLLTSLELVSLAPLSAVA